MKSKGMLVRTIMLQNNNYNVPFEASKQLLAKAASHRVTRSSQKVSHGICMHATSKWNRCSSCTCRHKHYMLSK